jgi:hypothetical protein
MTRRQIENMTYGTGAQMDAADAWWARFMAWMHSRPESADHPDHEPFMTIARRRLLTNTVWRLANRRHWEARTQQERAS